MALGERFVVAPERWGPARAGSRWGEAGAVLECAGGPYRVRGLSPSQLEVARDQYAGWLRSPEDTGEDGVEVEVLEAGAGEFRTDQERPFEYQIDFDYRPDVIRLFGLNLVAEIALVAPWRARLWTYVADDPFRGVLENLLRVVVAYRLLAAGGALLHSAGVVHRGGALVCYGRSGAGKTTLARLSRDAGREILSDDLVGVLPGADGSRALRLPFYGDLGAGEKGDAQHPLGALCRLLKAERHRARPDSHAVALAALSAHAPSVNQDPHRRERLHMNLRGLVGSVPCLALEFARDQGFFAAVDGVL